MKILIDAMGGDNAPLCVLQGAAQAAAEFGDGMTLALLGDEQALKDCAAQNNIDLTPFEIIPCSEVVDMHDDPCCWTAAPTPSAAPICSTPSAPWAASMPRRSWAARTPRWRW